MSASGYLKAEEDEEVVIDYTFTCFFSDSDENPVKAIKLNTTHHMMRVECEPIQSLDQTAENIKCYHVLNITVQNNKDFEFICMNTIRVEDSMVGLNTYPEPYNETAYNEAKASMSRYYYDRQRNHTFNGQLADSEEGCKN